MISSFVARVAVQYAIRGKTLAGDRVINSPMAALANLVDGKTDFSPVIVVATSDYSSTVLGQDTQGGEATTKISICVLMPESARVNFNGQLHEIRGMGPFHAAVGDMIAGQILQALRDYENPWAKLWRMIATSIVKVTVSPPYIEADDSMTLPARMIMIEYKPIADPIPGRPMTATYSAFNDMLLANAGLAPLSPLFRGMIETPDEIPDWAYIIMQLGLTDVAATNAGIRPLDPEGDELAQVGVYDDDDDEMPDDGIILVPTTAEGAT